MAQSAPIISWLLDSDPALRWQVERDLLVLPEEQWQATRALTATEGFGRALLDKQDPDGQWAGGAHFPGDFDFEGPEAQPGQGQPYTSTSWSLNSLREWGVPASALGDTAARLERNCHWEYDNLPFWDGEVDACINAYTVSNGVWLGRDMSALAQWFVDHQMEEGGWNCEWVEGSTRSSFHSTLNSLNGLLDYEIATGDTRAHEARKKAEEYLLERRLINRMTTGERIAPWVERLTYPNRWMYSSLRVMDYFVRAYRHDNQRPDPRMVDAINIVRDAQDEFGRWVQGPPLKGRVWFEVDVPQGEQSKWLTLQAMRVLNWWDR